MGQKFIITEEEKNDILSLYDTKKSNIYLFESMISVDGRYIIYQDEIYDNINQQSFGNVWESMDNFKMLFGNVKIDNPDYMVIRENILSLPILENKNTLYSIRDSFINEDFFKDTWVGNELKNAYTGTTDFLSTSWDGLKKMGVAISQGDWERIKTLLGKGILYLLRELKMALYSNIGMVVDAILIATGVGKMGTAVAWGLVTVLDIYQIISNDWSPEEQGFPDWLKYLTLGFDLLGFGVASYVAITAKTAAAPLLAAVRKPSLIRQILSKSPKLVGFLDSMLLNIKKLPKFFNDLTLKLGHGSKLSKFISSILGKLGSVIEKFTNVISSLLGKKIGQSTVKNSIKSGTKTGGMLYGVEKGVEFFSGENKIQNQNMANYNNIIKTKYNGQDPFDL